MYSYEEKRYDYLSSMASDIERWIERSGVDTPEDEPLLPSDLRKSCELDSCFINRNNPSKARECIYCSRFIYSTEWDEFVSWMSIYGGKGSVGQAVDTGATELDACIRFFYFDQAYARVEETYRNSH